MGNVEIPFSQTTKYLGVTLDHRLLWTQHVAEKVSKCKKLLNLLNYALKRNWGPSPKLSLSMYTGVIRPALSYAASCWIHAVNTRKLLSQLNKIQRLGLLAVTQTAPSVPTAGLSVLYDVLPLHIYLKLLAVKTYNRLPECFLLE